MYILPSFKLMFQIYSPNCVERLQTTPGCPRPYWGAGMRSPGLKDAFLTGTPWSQISTRVCLKLQRVHQFQVHVRTSWCPGGSRQKTDSRVHIRVQSTALQKPDNVPPPFEQLQNVIQTLDASIDVEKKHAKHMLLERCACISSILHPPWSVELHQCSPCSFDAGLEVTAVQGGDGWAGAVRQGGHASDPQGDHQGQVQRLHFETIWDKLRH